MSQHTQPQKNDDAIEVQEITEMTVPEKKQPEEQTQPVVAVDSSDSHHALLSHWKENNKIKRNLPSKKQILNVSRAGNKIYLIEKRKPLQLELNLPTDQGAQGAIIAGIQRMFQAEGLRHWAALLRLWSIEGGRTGRVRWVLDEHLAALGYHERQQRNQEIRDRISLVIQAMTRLEFVLFDGNGKERFRAPLIHVELAKEIKVDENVNEEEDDEKNWRVEGMILRANEALFSGIRDFETGRIGKNWWPVPPELATINHCYHPHAVPLGLLLAIRWRWAMNEGKDFISLKGENLARLAGLTTEKHNEVRTLEAIERDLTALQDIKLVGHWEWKGKPGFAKVITLWPSQWSTNIAFGSTKLIEAKSEADVPVTGESLRIWRKEKCLTQEQLAERLGVSERTIRRIEEQKKLSMKVISKLRLVKSNIPEKTESIDPREKQSEQNLPQNVTETGAS